MQITTTKKTFIELVEACKFDYKYIIDSYKPEKPWPEHTGQTVEIELWHPNKITTNQEFLDHCKEVGGRPATFNEALQLALENPELQKIQQLATYDLEQLCCLCLDGDGGKRYLHVFESIPGHDWIESVRFLVAPALPASSKKLAESELNLEILPFDPSKLSFEYEGRKFKVMEE